MLSSKSCHQSLVVKVLLSKSCRQSLIAKVLLPKSFAVQVKSSGGARKSIREVTSIMTSLLMFIKTSQNIQLQDPVSYSDLVCEAHNMHNIDVDIPDDSIADINYKTFSKFVRPVAQEANPKATGPQITSLVGSKWREFRELYGIDETPEVERLKAGSGTNESGSDADSKGVSCFDQFLFDFGQGTWLNIICLFYLHYFAPENQ